MTATSRLADWRERWRDGSMTALLVFQGVTIFGLVPASASGLPISSSLAALLLVIVSSLTIALARGAWAPMLGVAMLLLAGATAVLQGWFHGPQVRIAGEVSGFVTFLLLGAVVIRAVFGPGRFTGHRIRGAVVFYLNLGLLFAFVHRIVAELVPDAYAHLPPAEQAASFRAALDYFSFSTLTSVGYGDIVPVNPVARALCALEAAAGQLLPTILIARVVTRTVQSDLDAEKGSDGE